MLHSEFWMKCCFSRWFKMCCLFPPPTCFNMFLCCLKHLLCIDSCRSHASNFKYRLSDSICIYPTVQIGLIMASAICQVPLTLVYNFRDKNNQLSPQVIFKLNKYNAHYTGSTSTQPQSQFCSKYFH